MYVCRAHVIATLFCVPLGLGGLSHAAICDIDADGDVDRLDIKSVVTSRNTSVGPGDLRDADGDGTITVLDARICIRQCNQPGCPVIEPAVSRPSETAGQAGAATAGRTGNADTTTSGRANTGSGDRTRAAGSVWKVARGDTLYAISRTIFPGDAGRQAHLRQDIVNLNPAVFANGADNMAVGTVLRLPDYVAAKSALVEPVVPETAIPPAAGTSGTSESTTVVAPPEPAPKPAAPAPAAAPEITTPSRASSEAVRAESNALISLGYSYGGEKLDYEEMTYGPGGVGGHLRLGFEQMFEQYGGYRLAIGYQYSSDGDGGGSLSFDDTYWQLAYQYKSNQLVYGIGILHSRGATLKDGSSVDYDPADGLIVYLENAGSSGLDGLGLSYTALEIEQKDSGETYDVSRAELYYNWKF